MKKISILGSTGSIGTQALEVCSTHSFDVVGLLAYSNEKLLEEQVRKFRPKIACIADPARYQSFRTRVSDLPVKVVTGLDGLCETATIREADTVLNAVMGMIGLRPTLAASEAGKEIALANKETLVTGGELVMKKAKEKGVRILPVDSEHSAIFQCIEGYRHCPLNKILLTASGGPFFGKKREDLEKVTVESALKHPNWSMGAKITIDSATLMNKGLEIIEAVHLFKLPPEKIEVVVHRESVIHSAVEFEDFSVIAQMGVPDMKIPIQYALTYPKRIACPVKQLNLFEYGTLSFYPYDADTFPTIGVAQKAIAAGKLYPTLLNSANERLVSLFLEGKIRFLDILDTVERIFSLNGDRDVTLENILDGEEEARQWVDSLFC